MKEIRKCTICEKEKMYFPSDIKRGRGNLCSRQCYYKSRIGKHIHSEEFKRKLSILSRSPEHIEKVRRALIGRKFSEETKNKLREAHKNRKPVTEETKIKMRLSAKTRPTVTEETRRKRSESLRGEKGSNWRGGLTKIHERIRNSVEYRIWRETVFKRDNFTCQYCKQRGGKLNADHIKPFSLFPELRFDINNGRTLCIECHRKTDTYGWSIYHSKKVYV